MAGKSTNRSMVISAAALIVMGVVFIAVWDWGGEDTPVVRELAVRTSPASNSTLPVTVPPTADVAETAVPSESNDIVDPGPEPPREVTYEEAETAFYERHYDKAMELFTLYTDRKTENPWGHYMLGLSAWKAGDYDRAESALRRALELDPNHMKSQLNLSRVLLDMGKPMEALEEIRDALVIDPESNVAYRLKGRMFRQIGQKPQAVDAYRRAIQIDTEDAWSMNNLGLLYIEEGLFEKALLPLSRAVELQSDNVVFLNNLGMALESTGHFRAAHDVYESAVALDDSYEKASANMDRVAVVLEDPDLEPVDLAVIAQSFVEEVERWGTVMVENSEPDTTRLPVMVETAAAGGPSESDDPIAETVVVGDADSTGNDREE